MPIQSCTLPDGGEGYRWGGEGKCYASRSDAVKQAEAAYANGYTGDEAHRAAGVIVREPGGKVLFLKRSADAPDYPETWCWPGGGAEAGEDSDQTAMRELSEETGIVPVFTDPAPIVDVRDGFVTHLLDLDEMRQPTLNEEHTEFRWAHPNEPPEPTHPGTLATLRECQLPERSAMTGDRAMKTRDQIALDRASVRRIDPESGHMHVSETPISKATVNPYWGSEIPGFRELGLDPEKTYQVLRPAEELEKAAATFAGKPLLITHKPMEAEDHDRTVAVGSVGSNVRFNHPYLLADLNVWDGEAIAGIESDEQRELSCGYAYDPVIESGEFEGKPYDLRMTNIRGNHVALVPEGRAGPDVLVGDQKLKGQPMKLQTKALPSRKALLLQGAISAALVGKLAADASIDLTPTLDGVTRTNLKAKLPSIKKGLTKALTGKLAADEDIGEVVETVAELIDNLRDVQSGEADEDDLAGMDEDKDDEEKKDEGAKDESEEDKDKKDGAEDDKEDGDGEKKPEAKDKGARDEEKDDDKVSKKAMDAALAKAREDGAKEAVRRVQAIAEAKRQVRPLVGDLDGDFESAAAVHKFALDAAIDQGLDIDLTDVPISAYGALVKTAIQLTEAQARKPATTTHDSKGATKAAELFPDLARIRVL